MLVTRDLTLVFKYILYSSLNFIQNHKIVYSLFNEFHSLNNSYDYCNVVALSKTFNITYVTCLYKLVHFFLSGTYF